MGSRSNWRAYAALLAVYFFWGTTYIGIRMSLEALTPALLMAVRFTISGLILLIGARFARVSLPKGRELWTTAAYGVIALGGGTGALVFAEQTVPSGIAALFISTTPFWMIGIDAFQKAGDRIRPATIVGILIGFLGILVLIGPAAFGVGLGPQIVKGFFVLQAGCFSWCLGSVLQKRNPTTANAVVSGAIQQFATGLAFIPIALLAEEPTVKWGTRGVWAVLYLVIFGSIVGYSSFIYAMEHLPVSIVSTYAYVNPIVAVTLGWMIYKESFGPREAAAMALVIAGVLIVKYWKGIRLPVRETSSAT